MPSKKMYSLHQTTSKCDLQKAKTKRNFHPSTETRTHFSSPKTSERRMCVTRNEKKTIRTKMRLRKRNRMQLKGTKNQIQQKTEEPNTKRTSTRMLCSTMVTQKWSILSSEQDRSLLNKPCPKISNTTTAKTLQKKWPTKANQCPLNFAFKI